MTPPFESITKYIPRLFNKELKERYAPLNFQDLIIFLLINGLTYKISNLRKGAPY